jgi:hypothetical protein
MAGHAVDAAKPLVLAAAARLIAIVALWCAAPFFAFAFLGYLLEWSALAVGVLAALGALVLLAGFAAWLLVWSLLRKTRDALHRAADEEPLWT